MCTSVPFVCPFRLVCLFLFRSLWSFNGSWSRAIDALRQVSALCLCFNSHSCSSCSGCLRLLCFPPANNTGRKKKVKIVNMKQTRNNHIYKDLTVMSHAKFSCCRSLPETGMFWNPDFTATQESTNATDPTSIPSRPHLRCGLHNYDATNPTFGQVFRIKMLPGCVHILFTVISLWTHRRLRRC